MNKIQVISKIKRDKLDSINYFQSIIKEACIAKLLNDNDMSNIQIQLLELLDKIVYKYNKDDSSSIRKEILEEISNSNNYIIGIYLKIFNNPDEAINIIKEKGLTYCYNQGRKRIDKLLNISRIGYNKVRQNMLKINNDTYNDTVIDGIKGFFKMYNPDFRAYDNIITADYPTYISFIGKLEGIEFIKEYLNSIYLENCYCGYFSQEIIRQLLISYSNNYDELIINIFEIVFFETIACKLVNEDVKDLIISKAKLNQIYEIFENKSDEEIKQCIWKAYYEIKNEIFDEYVELHEYIEKGLDDKISSILQAYRYNKLEEVFITEKYIEK